MHVGVQLYAYCTEPMLCTLLLGGPLLLQARTCLRAYTLTPQTRAASDAFQVLYGNRLLTCFPLDTLLPADRYVSGRLCMHP
jgi:hypothetical protein